MTYASEEFPSDAFPIPASNAFFRHTLGGGGAYVWKQFGRDQIKYFGCSVENKRVGIFRYGGAASTLYSIVPQSDGGFTISNGDDGKVFSSMTAAVLGMFDLVRQHTADTEGLDEIEKDVRELHSSVNAGLLSGTYFLAGEHKDLVSEQLPGPGGALILTRPVAMLFRKPTNVGFPRDYFNTKMRIWVGGERLADVMQKHGGNTLSVTLPWSRNPTYAKSLPQMYRSILSNIARNGTHLFSAHERLALRDFIKSMKKNADFPYPTDITSRS